MSIQTNSASFINKEYLINNFNRMIGDRKEGSSRSYTHFVPKPANGTITQVSDSNTYPICECNCRDEMGRTWRELIVENSILEKVEQTFERRKPLVIYSLGSGGCYSELSICIGLAKKGYQVQQVVLVDHAYDFLEKDLRVVQFSLFCKVLFPDAQISAYGSEGKYFEEINNLNQTKPDLILCIDVEESCISFRRSTYSKMLESSLNPCIFAYHNPIDPHDVSKGVCTEIETLQGSAT
jgi:hypothetical protein